MLFSSDGRSYVRRKPGTRYEIKNLQSTVKFGGRSVMTWGCFTSKGLGEIAFIDGKMNADGYSRIIDYYLMKSFEKLNMQDYIFKQDNDPKRTSMKVKEYLDAKKVKRINWHPQSPDMNPIENFWCDLKRRVKQRNPTNMK